MSNQKPEMHWEKNRKKKKKGFACGQNSYKKFIVVVSEFHFTLTSVSGLFFFVFLFKCITFCCYCVSFSPMIHLALGHLLKFLIQNPREINLTLNFARMAT